MLNEWNKLIKEVQSDCGQLMSLLLEMVKRNQDVCRRVNDDDDIMNRIWMKKQPLAFLQHR